MIFKPEKYRIPDVPMQPFIDADEIWSFIHGANTDREYIRSVIAKSLDKERLTLAETASLIAATDPELIEEIKEGARQLKERVYGNRIVLLPLCMWAAFAQTIASIAASGPPTRLPSALLCRQKNW